MTCEHTGTCHLISLLKNSLSQRWVRDAGGPSSQVEPVREAGIRLSLMALEAACGPSLLDNDDSVVSFPPRLLWQVGLPSLPWRLQLWPLPLSLVGGVCAVQSSSWDSQDTFPYWWHKLKRKRFSLLFPLYSLHHWTLGLHMSKWSNVWVVVNILGPGLYCPMRVSTIAELPSIFLSSPNIVFLIHSVWTMILPQGNWCWRNCVEDIWKSL